jgi:rubrerythrin
VTGYSRYSYRDEAEDRAYYAEEDRVAALEAAKPPTRNVDPDPLAHRCVVCGHVAYQGHSLCPDCETAR